MATRWNQDQTDVERAWQQADASLSPTPAPTTASPATPWVSPGQHGGDPSPAPASPLPDTSGWQQTQPIPGPTDYTASLGPTASAPPPAAPAPGGMPATAVDSVHTYSTYLDQINGASDPRQQLVARDALARQLQADLEADGHAIKWQGDTMIIDGRAYELGSGARDSYTRGTAAGQDMSWMDQPGAVSPEYLQPARGTSPLSSNWLDPFSPPQPQDPYYAGWRGANPNDPNAQANPIGPQLGQPAAAAGGAGAPTAAHLQSLLAGGMSPQEAIARFNQETGRSTGNEAVFYDGSVHGRPTIGLPDAYLSLEDDGQWHVSPRMPEGAGAGAPRSGATGAGGGGRVGNNFDFNALWDSMPDALKNWKPSGPGYSPDPIDTQLNDLPGFDKIYELLSKDDPEEAKLQQLVGGILEHPESINERDVEMLKAKNAEEAALAGQAQDEELQHFGYGAGLDSSPWLAGQRSQNAWDRRQATIGSNRQVDIAAANTRQSDRLAAAELGKSFAQYRTAKGQQKLNIAVEAALGKAGEQRSRKALNESLKQTATQLGLSRDSLIVGYITNNMSFLTQNKGLDLGYDIDIKKLSQQSDEFKHQLAQRIAEMKQADDQFKANYGLAAQEFGHRKDQDYWERAKSAAG